MARRRPPLLLLALKLLTCLESLAAVDLSPKLYGSNKNLTRCSRESRPLIGPFDLSKRPKKKPNSERGSMAALSAPSSRWGGGVRSSAPSSYVNTTTSMETHGSVATATTAVAMSVVETRPVSARDTTTPTATGGGSQRVTHTATTALGEGAARVGKRAAIVGGDIVLGGLVTVHGRAAVGGAGECGRPVAAGGVQALEAMLFALDAAAGLAPPAVRLGALVLDDCGSDARGLEMALDFIKGSIGNIEEGRQACNASAVRTAVRTVVSGVVGAASSGASVQVANLLRLFRIPQVSYFSTSPELSNKARFEYFTRTIPSDLHQVTAMVEIVKKLGWRYVSIIYEESNYGIKAFEELETMLARNHICIAVKERLMKGPGAADQRNYDGVVERLLARPRARGVIVFASEQRAAGVMAAAGRRGAGGALSWLGSDGWAARTLVTAGNEPVVEGTISVQPSANPVQGFRDYFLNLTVENNARNPWFAEFWEEHFRCRHPGSPRTAHSVQYPRTCSGRERLAAAGVRFEARLQFVADAVFAFVHAIRDMHRELCGGGAGLCDAMRPVSGPALLRYLRQVRFIGLSGDEFYFDANGDGPARYDILHFKQVWPGAYRWLKVGTYVDGELQLHMNELQFSWGQTRPPESLCSAECARGQAKRYVDGESCCWHCFNYTQYEIRSPTSETACALCPRGTRPDRARARCAPLPALYLRPGDPPAIAAMAFAALGVLLTAFVFAVWVVRGDTPVVRASGRELSFVLLSGIMMCYLVTFILVLRPTDFICSLQRFATGFCFTVVYAALLTKTNRIARIFNASKHSARRPSLISPKSQLLICSLLVSVQVVVVAAWQAAAPARAVRRHPARDRSVLACDAYVDGSYTLAFCYPAALIAVCTAHAVITRNIPEAFNESKHIGFTMYTTCVIWSAFVPLYFGTASHVPMRVTSMAVTISLSASVTLACLFAPKVYIIVVRPERNVRAALTAARWRGGAARGAVCAALVCAAPVPPAPTAAPAPPAATPSTDLSPLDVTERSTSTDREVQTDSLSNDTNGLYLDPRRLAAAPAGLPALPTARRRRAAFDPAAP